MQQKTIDSCLLLVFHFDFMFHMCLYIQNIFISGSPLIVFKKQKQKVDIKFSSHNALLE
jgi:hypothetical protein